MHEAIPELNAFVKKGNVYYVEIVDLEQKIYPRRCFYAG